MKRSGIVNYDVKEVYNIFKKNAKKDFKDFTEENAVGCKIIKNITTGGVKPIRCTVEITAYEKNNKYEITTSNEFSKCISTYTFISQVNGTTKIILNEVQTTKKFLQLATLWIQRFMAKRNFKRSFQNIIDGLNNELRIYHENLERSCKKNEQA